MLYLLDANVLIDADRDYYPIARVPEFWDWLVYHGESGSVKLPIEIYEEIKDGKSEMGAWARDAAVQAALLLDEEAEAALVSTVVESGYATDLTDSEISTIGRDPFLVSYALVDLSGRFVVTKEVSRPSKQRANRKVPDVCDALGVHWMDAFSLLRALDFRTSWKTSP